MDLDGFKVKHPKAFLITIVIGVIAEVSFIIFYL